MVGETGSGKTSILSDITEEMSGAGHSIKSGETTSVCSRACVGFFQVSSGYILYLHSHQFSKKSNEIRDLGTKKHEIWPCIIEGQQYLFVDTPGFGSHDLDNDSVFDDIMSCLFAIGPFVTTVGVMFLHDITQPRMSAGEMKTFRWLQCFCGPQFYEKITIITSKWDIYTKERDKKLALGRLEELKRDIFPPILGPPLEIPAGRLYNNGLLDGDKKNWENPLDCVDDQKQRAEAARQLIHTRYGNVDKVPELQIRSELDFGRRLGETEAAKVLNASATKTTVVILRRKAILMDLDAAFETDPATLKSDQKTEPKEQAKPFYESPMKELVRKGTMYSWLDIAKQVAGLFMTQRSSITKEATQLWERIKGWWFA